MIKQLSFFQKIDQFLFKQIDFLKGHPLYGKYREFMSVIPSEFSPWISQGIVFLILLVPLFFLLLFMMSNSSYRSEIASKEEILYLSNKILKNQRELAQIQGQLIGFVPIRSQSELDLKIRESAGQQKIDVVNFRVENFETQTEGQLITTKAQLTYRNLAQGQLLYFLENLITNHKMRIGSIKIKKNPQNELLEGEAHLLYFARENTL